MCFETEKQNEKTAQQTTTEQTAGKAKKGKNRLEADTDLMALVSNIVDDMHSGVIATGGDLEKAMKERLTAEQISSIALNFVFQQFLGGQRPSRSQHPLEGLLDVLKGAMKDRKQAKPEAEQPKEEAKAQSQDTAEDDCNCGDFASAEVAISFAEKMATISEKAATDDTIQTKGDIKKLVIESDLTSEELAIAATELIVDRLKTLDPLEAAMHKMMQRRG